MRIGKWLRAFRAFAKNLVMEKIQATVAFLAAFAANRQALFDMRKILDLVVIMAMMPVLIGMLSGMSTGDPTTDALVTAISAILPMMMLIDVVSGMTNKRR